MGSASEDEFSLSSGDEADLNDMYVKVTTPVKSVKRGNDEELTTPTKAVKL
jgi:hypothetical protein